MYLKWTLLGFALTLTILIVMEEDHYNEFQKFIVSCYLSAITAKRSIAKKATNIDTAFAAAAAKAVFLFSLKYLLNDPLLD